MKNFESHLTFENQNLKVEINFMGLVQITDKDENKTKISKPCVMHEAIRFYTQMFREEAVRGNHQIRQ